MGAWRKEEHTYHNDPVLPTGVLLNCAILFFLPKHIYRTLSKKNRQKTELRRHWEQRCKTEDNVLLKLTSSSFLYQRRAPTGRASGVGFLINKKLTNRIMNVTRISDRAITPTIKLTKRYNLRTRQVYATTNSLRKTI